MIKTKPSIFITLLVAFLLVILPLYLAGFFVYNWGVKQVKDEISQSLLLRNRSVLDLLEREIFNLGNNIANLLNSSDLRLLAVSGSSMSQTERIFAMRQVQERLRLFMVSSSFVANASLHVPAIRRSIHVLGGITNLDDDHCLELNQAAQAAAGQIRQNADELVLYLAHPQQFPGQALAATYMLEVSFNQAALARTLHLASDKSQLALFSSMSGDLLAAAGPESGAAAYFLDQAGLLEGDYFARVAYAEQEYLVTISRQPASQLVLVGYTDQERIFLPLLRFRPFFWLFTLLVLALAALFFILLYRLIHRPLQRFLAAFAQLEQGDFSVGMQHLHQDEFQKLSLSFNRMVRELSQLVDQVYKQKIYAQQAELKQLQSQISPHFLYNSFFVLQDMADNNDAESMSVYAGLMGRYFRYITRKQNTDASLQEEYDHACNYAQLQARRFRNRIKLQLADLPSGLADCLVPRLILQPVLENAFEHGLKNKVADGLIRLTISQAGEQVLLRISDNGSEMTEEKLADLRLALTAPAANLETTGLSNVHRRLQLRFGEKCGLELALTEGGGLTVCLLIQLEKAGDLPVQALDS